MTTIAEVEANTLQKWMVEQATDVQLIDVREPHEVARGAIEGSQHIPLKTIPDHLNTLNRDVPIVVLCHSGVRSAHACMFLAAQGFDNVFNLRGGIVGWARQGLAFSAPFAA